MGMNTYKLIILCLIVVSPWLSQVVLADEGDIVDFSVTSDIPHNVKIYNEGITSLKTRLDMIDSATESIKIESFIYTLDPVGKVITERLLEKAREGVKVQIMMDPLVSKSSVSPYHIHELREKGVEVKYYNTKPLIMLGPVQYRNHRKLFAVDGKRAFVGGRNIGDEYFDVSPDYNFTDRDIYIEGPIVSEMVETFDAFWNSKHAVAPERRERPDPNSRRWFMGGGDPQRKFDRAEKRWVRKVNEAKREIWANESDEETVNRAFTLALSMDDQDQVGVCPSVTFVTDRPGIGIKNQKRKRILKYEIFKRLLEAEGEVFIENPYFIVDKETKDVLQNLYEREVPVSVLTNSLYSTDNIAVAAVFNSTMGKWIRRGIKTYVYKADPLETTISAPEADNARWGIHAKTFVFDEDSFMIGSYNFDPRSNNFNMELGLFCDGSLSLTSGVIQNIQERLEQSHFVDSVKTFNQVKFKNINFGKRLNYYLALIPSLLFDHLL